MKTESILTKSQKRVYGPKPITGWGLGALIKATVRYDDQCGNGRNSFAVTGEIYRPGKDDCEACGCLHDEIAKAFPELAPLLKWHLCDSAGPMHYISDTLYLAGNRDCWGLLAGERRQFTSRGKYQNGGVEGVPCWVSVTRPGVEMYAHEVPEVSEWMPYYNHIGEGKARELDAARACAIWPEATDEQLSADPAVLRTDLEARLPALLAEFRAAVESLGFTY